MSDQTPEKMTKAELIERTQVERKRFQELLGQLSEEQMLQPNVQGAWSVKDIVAHVIDWEERMIRWLGEGMRGETPVMPAPGLTWQDLDKLNEQTYQAHKDDPLAQVLADFERLEASVLEAIQAVPEEDLLASDRYPWTEGDPMWHLVAANTFWHYPGHAKKIQEKW
jgi:hypothetical protein